MAPSRHRRPVPNKSSATSARSAAIQAAEQKRREQEMQQTTATTTVSIEMPGIQVVVGNAPPPSAFQSAVDSLEAGKKRKKFSLLPPFSNKVVEEELFRTTTAVLSSSTSKRRGDHHLEQSQDDDDEEEDDDDEVSDDEGCLHCHEKVKFMPRIRVIEDNDDEHNNNSGNCRNTRKIVELRNDGDDDDGEGYSKGNNNNNIQVRCDDCRGYICNGCHWCHEFQANHEIRVCDRCDAFYCRGCDEMDQCDDCGEVVCGSCSTLLSCKFCGGGLCEECATACGRCGIVLCSRDAKFAVDCDTCRLSYCLVCLASGSKDPCVRCGHRPSKRMEQLVHLRLKSIYKAFKSSGSGGGSNGNGGGNTIGGNQSNNNNSKSSGDNAHRDNINETHNSHGGRSRRNKPTTLQDMVGDQDDDDDVLVDPAMSMMMGAAAGVLPHKFCHDLEQNYIAEQKKADAAAEALLAELEEEETAIAQKKSKKKKKKERKNASKQQHQSEDTTSNRNTGKDNSDTTTKTKSSQNDIPSRGIGNDQAEEDHSSETESIDRAIKDYDEFDGKGGNPDEPKMDPVEKELVECVNNYDLDGIEDILFRLKGVPGRAALRKNAKKALKRLKLELDPPPPTPPEPKILEVPSSRTEKKSPIVSARSPSGISKPLVVVDPKASKKSTLKSPPGHEKPAPTGAKPSHPKSSFHKNAANSNRSEAVVEIVSRLVGWMIGKNGQRIRDLMEESGAKIWIDQEKFKGQETRNVYISGDRKSVDHAVTLVNDVITNAPPPQGSTGAVATAVATTAMATMMLSPKQGPQTPTDPVSPPVAVEIKSAWAKSSQIKVDNPVPGMIPKPPSLISSSAPAGADEIKELLLETSIFKEPPGLATPSNALAADVINPAGDHSLKPNADHTTEIVTCEARFVPLLIGKRGWTIKHIQDDSGARVDIDQGVTPRQVRISGSKANVDKAVTMVRDVLSYPHAQLQSSSECVDDDDSGILPRLGGININQSETHLLVSSPIKQDLLAASAVLEHDAARNDTTPGMQSPPPMVGDAKSAISASSSLSSTPEPSMASSSKGFIPSHLQNGPLLPPPMEQYNMGTNPPPHSPRRFLQPEGGVTDGMVAAGLWPSTGFTGGPSGAVAPQALYAESTGQLGMQSGGPMTMPQGPPSHPQIHQQLQQQNRHLQMNPGLILEQPFGPPGQISHRMASPSNPNGSPMIDRSSPFTSQSIGNNQPNRNVHSTLGGGASYNLYSNEAVPVARAIATTPLRDLMQAGGASNGASPMGGSGFRESSNGLWNSGNPNYSSSGLPPQAPVLQPRTSSGFSPTSMGFSSGQHHNESRVDKPLGYTNSQMMPSQHIHSNTNQLSVGAHAQAAFAGSMPPGLRNDDSLMIDSLFGRTHSTPPQNSTGASRIDSLFGHSNSTPTPNAAATSSLLTGFNGLSLPSQGDAGKSSSLWGSNDPVDAWRETNGSATNDPGAATPDVSAIGNIFSNEVPNLSQDRPQQSRFNWDSTNGN